VTARYSLGARNDATRRCAAFRPWSLRRTDPRVILVSIRYTSVQNRGSLWRVIDLIGLQRALQLGLHMLPRNGIFSEKVLLGPNVAAAAAARSPAAGEDDDRLPRSPRRVRRVHHGVPWHHSNTHNTAFESNKRLAQKGVFYIRLFPEPSKRTLLDWKPQKKKHLNLESPWSLGIGFFLCDHTYFLLPHLHKTKCFLFWVFHDVAWKK